MNVDEKEASHRIVAAAVTLIWANPAQTKILGKEIHR